MSILIYQKQFVYSQENRKLIFFKLQSAAG